MVLQSIVQQACDRLVLVTSVNQNQRAYAQKVRDIGHRGTLAHIARVNLRGQGERVTETMRKVSRGQKLSLKRSI